MTLTVIDNYDSFVYNIVRYLKEESCSVTVMRNDHIDREKLTTCDAIILSPGPGIPEEAGELMQVIEEFHKLKPMLGICLGHQALGSFFGASLLPAENIVHGRTSTLRVTANDPIFDELGNTIEVGRYHSWLLGDPLPEALIKTSETLDGEVMSFRHGQLPISGVQFHPESILTPSGRKMLRNWLNSLIRIQP
jgi:anthranilate synthase component 2